MNTRKSYCVPESVVHGGSAAMTVISVAFANFHDINIRIMTYSKLECHVIECSVRKRHTQQPSWASASQCQHTAASGWHLLGTESRRGEIRNRGFFFHPWGAVCPSHFYFSLYLSLERFFCLLILHLAQSQGFRSSGHQSFHSLLTRFPNTWFQNLIIHLSFQSQATWVIL